MTPEEDDALARRLRATLEEAAGRPDPELEQRVDRLLRQARPAAPVTRLPARRALAGMALAAGLAAVIWLPVKAPESPVRTDPLQAGLSVPPSVETEFLDDLELLAVAGEDPDES